MLFSLDKKKKISLWELILTPDEFLSFLHVSDSAWVLSALLGYKRHTPGKMEHPALSEGQVCLFGLRNYHSILQKFNADVWRMETTHMADQVIVLAKFTRVITVHLDFRLG